MRREKIRQTPTGIAGLVRYFDEEKSILKLKPEHVIAICGAIIVIELILMLLS